MQLGNTPFERSIASSLTLSSNLIISYGVNTQIYQLMREEVELTLQSNGAPGYYEAASLHQRWSEIARCSAAEA